MAERFQYTKNVMKHFLHPKNLGEVKNPDGVGKVGNMKCGDEMLISIKVGKKKQKGKEIEYLKEIKFKTTGCAAAIATSSMTTVLAKNQPLEKAKKISRQDVAKALGGLPALKMHCSNLAADALHEAIKDYETRKKS